MNNFDEIDEKIALWLSRDADVSGQEMGDYFGLSQSAIWRRIRAMEAAGVIQSYALLVDEAKLGYEVTVYLGVKLALKGRHALEDFERAVQSIAEVVLVQHTLGVYDYRLRVIAKDLPDFERILRRRIMTLPGIGNVESNVLLKVEKSEY